MKPICKERAFEAICDQTDQDKSFKVRPALTEYPTENHTMFNQISDVKCNLKFKLFKLTGS